MGDRKRLKMKWNKIENDRDIESLIEKYYGFHDSYISELNYKTGIKKETEGDITLGEAKKNKLYLKFESQYKEKQLELCFIEVRKFNVVGWQENYISEIFECYLKRINDINHKEKSYIIWADDGDFNPKNICDEQETIYVIANNLKWRYIEK